MSGLDTKYIPLSSIQEQFWDKLYDAPLAGGTIYFFKDNQRTISKDVYTLSGNPPDYSYVSLGSSITLSSIGTLDDGLGNNLVPYLYPYDSNGNIELYYITVYNSGNQFQFAVGGFPNIPTTSEPANIAGQDNFIPNGQFLLGQNSGTISDTVTNVAYGNWQYIRSSNASTDTVTFPRFTAPLNGIPTGNPRYACRIACTVPSAGDTYKTLQVVFKDVNRFSDPNQQLTLYFEGLNNQTGLLQLNVDLYKNFGVGGSAPTTTPIGSMAFSNTGYSSAALPFFFGSNYGNTLGTANDDYFAIQIQLPPTTTFDISLTDFCLYLGNVDVTAYPFTVNPIPTFDINIKTFTTSGTYTPTPNMFKCIIECIGGGAGGGGADYSLLAIESGGGGGAGGYSKTVSSSYSIGASQVVTIGALGTGGAAGNNAGNAGTATSVGTLCIANGGAGGGGSNGNGGGGGPGGLIGTGNVAFSGASGATGSTGGSAANSYSAPGAGASGISGTGGVSGSIGTGSIGNGVNASGYGAGGSGGGSCQIDSGPRATGGNGAPGIVIITEYILG